jgi:hypothetical protein
MLAIIGLFAVIYLFSKAGWDIIFQIFFGKKK